MEDVAAPAPGADDSAVVPRDADTVLGEVFRQHYTALVALARLLIDRPHEAEEIVQEAFCRTFAAWTRLRSPTDPLPYVRTTVVNLCRTGLRRRRTQRSTPVHAVPPAAGADEGALLTERQAAIAEALRSLPLKQREVVALRYLLDCSTAETAVALGIAEGSVKSHLHRALAALEASLEDER